jgi:membrane-associated phospholipid phosphatase
LLVTGSAGLAPAQDFSGSDPAPALDRGLERFLPDAADRDGRRTLSAFPRNLGRSFVGVFAKDNLAPFMLGAAASAASFNADVRAQRFLSGRADEFGKLGATAGGASVMAPLTLTLFAAGRFAKDTRFRAFSYDATQAVIVDMAYTSVLKAAARRTRPDGSSNASLPSGHTSTAFAWATVAQKHYGWKAGVPGFLAASAIGISRIERDRHHLSDVLAGATLGMIVGRTVVRQNGGAPGRGFTLALQPATDAQGTGKGIGASLSW